MDDVVKKDIYLISSKIPQCFLRLISVAPILCLFSMLPLYLPPKFFSSLFSTIPTILGKQNEVETVSDIIKKNISVFSAIPISLSYCYFISLRIPKGFYRLISLIPILGLFTILPLFLPPAYSTILIASLITGNTIGRLILFAFAEGPISSPRPSQSLYNFIVYAALPTQTPSSGVPSINPNKNAADCDKPGIKILTFAVLIGFISQYQEVLRPGVLMVAYGLFLYLFMECTWASAKYMFHALLGLDLVPMFNEVYFSTSLQDFWGRRWNLVVLSTLRQTVYKPVRSTSAVLLGNRLALATAYLATFLVSGLSHELMLYYLTRVNPSGEMTAFFVVHGVCVILEVAVKKALRGRLSSPRWFVSAPLTIGFVLLTSVWLFFPPVIRGGVDRMVFREFRYVKELFQNGITLIGF